ncbi:2-phosphosulfolactate phosphatase [Tepidibacillus fermentans]|uniref:Probable 2-phosphosulfolactate phosphatase n=1 Tax=Tepidibacillus fermentans TaxID=1281767 RepID=A0A4R3KKL5_9BACI|nr:2-phosphosulfolactate phosphatase [Tepidibacillus fermentans]TCS84020.1 2-phosphosulfolactate phosphatase [Tepidibacillus fermentans]
MLVDVIPIVDEVKNENLYKKTVIIVDILRTSSTIITALANGIEWIIPAETIGQVKTIKNIETSALLAGDRFSKKIQEFDLGNSPLEYTSLPLKNKKIILTTTNGTRAIQKAGKGEYIFIGGFLNGASCIQKALKLKRDIVILCVGNRNEFALEDGLAAGFLIDTLMKNSDQAYEINDFGKAVYGMYKYYEDKLTDILKTTETAKRLTQLGFGDDIHFSSQINYYSVCPKYDPSKNMIKPSSD